MKTRVIPLIAISLLLCGPSFAAFSWQMYDFGTGPFDHNNNWSPIDYPYGVGQLPSPGLIGEGGEKFDLEGFHFAIEGSTVHVALVNSFGYLAHSTGWDRDYRLGDIFFGFNGANTQYAIDISEGKLYEVGLGGLAYNQIPDEDGTYHDYPGIRNQAGAWEISSGTFLSDVDNSLTFWDDLETDPLMGSGDTYVWEFAFDLGTVGGFTGASNISFHNTLECGNDLIEESYNIIPEPATLLLFALGLSAAGVMRRKFR
jgi:hypothetical protein